MAERPLRPCAIPGCPELVRGDPYCRYHQYKNQEQKAERHRYYDQHQRDQRAAEFYNSSAWQKLRRYVLARDHHLCQECLGEKRITPADVVHHLVPISEDWGRRLDSGNCVSLCASCHNRIHSGK